MQIDATERSRYPDLAGAGRIADTMSGDGVSGPASWIILDVEGTLVPTAYVHTTLFDYARAGLRDWIIRNAGTPVGAEALDAVRRSAGLPGPAGLSRSAGLSGSAGPSESAGTTRSATADPADLDEIVTVLLDWTAQDRKDPALKAIQGFVWQEGYARGELRTPLFPDVPPALHRWRAAGYRLGIFSSGSVAAQQAVFSRTDAGDLRDLFVCHFDPQGVGSKRESAAYRAMSAGLTGVDRGRTGADDGQTGVDREWTGDGGRTGADDGRAGAGGRAMFLSDVPAELDAAAAAGWRTLGVARAGEPFGDADFGAHRVVRGLDRETGVDR